MLLVEIIAPLVVALLVAYGGAAYRLGLPSPLTSRHERALRNIDRLERELQIGEYAPVQRLTPRDWIELPSQQLQRSPAPPRNVVQAYGNAFTNVLRAAKGYDGPALTDADVRRLEHPDETPQ